jgi:hypothetical protein
MSTQFGGDLVTKDGVTSQYVVSGFTDTYTMHLNTGSVSAETAFMLIDISNPGSVWGHTAAGHINLEYIILDVDPDSNFRGEVKLGFLENVDATNGDFYQIIDIDMQKSAAITLEVINFGSHGFDCESNHHFGPITANSTLFQTDVNLGGPDDPSTITYPSGAGDLVLLLTNITANAVDVAVTIGYETFA